MATSFPSPTNVYIPGFGNRSAATGRLIVEYSRNPASFVLPRWCQYVQVDRERAYYLKLNANAAGRVIDPNDFRWHHGVSRPQHLNALEGFSYVPIQTTRYDYGFTVPYATRDQADWQMVPQHQRISASLCMTNRTIRMVSEVTTVANWQTTADDSLSAHHTDTATNLAGGLLDAGTTASPYVKKAFDAIAELVMKDTLAAVSADQIMMVMNPTTARKIAESAEIHDYIKGSPAAIDEIRSGLSPNARYGPGLPSTLYGYQIVVEPAVRVTSRVGATLAKSFVWPAQTVMACSRVGGLDGGPSGGPSFSTATMFWYEDEMTLEAFDAPKDRLTEAHVVENTMEELTSPLSGYLITAATS